MHATMQCVKLFPTMIMSIAIIVGERSDPNWRVSIAVPYFGFKKMVLQYVPVPFAVVFKLFNFQG
jgi:hypothetical protein